MPFLRRSDTVRNVYSNRELFLQVKHFWLPFLRGCSDTTTHVCISTIKFLGVLLNDILFRLYLKNKEKKHFLARPSPNRRRLPPLRGQFHRCRYAAGGWLAAEIKFPFCQGSNNKPQQSGGSKQWLSMDPANGAPTWGVGFAPKRARLAGLAAQRVASIIPLEHRKSLVYKAASPGTLAIVWIIVCPAQSPFSTRKNRVVSQQNAES